MNNLASITYSTDIKPSVFKPSMVSDIDLVRAAFTPSTDGLQLWLDASEAASRNELVTGRYELLDKSGNGFTASAPTAQLPTLSTIGNREAVAFDGISQFLGAAGIGLTNPEISIFIVAQHSLTGADVILSSSGAGTGFLISATEFNLNLGEAITPTSSLASEGIESYRFLLDGTDSQKTIRRNLSPLQAETQNAPNAFTGINGVVIGTNAAQSVFSALRLGELIIYNRKLSDAETLSIETYLREKWGLALQSGQALPVAGSADVLAHPDSFTGFDALGRDLSLIAPQHGYHAEDTCTKGSAYLNVNVEDLGVSKHPYTIKVLVIVDQKADE